MNRTNRILSVALAVQLVLAVIVFFPRPAPEVATGPLLADFDSSAVTGLTITDADGNSITLAKGEDGGWSLPDYDDYPAQASSITNLLGKIGALQANRLIARNESSQARLEVKADNFQRRIELRSGDRTDTLYLGSASGASDTHARVNDQAEIYLTTGLAAWEVSAQVSSWIDTTYVSLDQTTVTAIQVQNANGTFDFTQTGGTWSYAELGAGEAFDTTKISSMTRQATGMRMSAPLGRTLDPAWGLDDPQATVTVTWLETVTPEPEPTATGPTATPFPTVTPSSLVSPLVPTFTPGGEDIPEEILEPTATPEPIQIEHTLTLLIGAQLDDGSYAVKSSESDYAVKVTAAVAEAFLNIAHDSLLLPPTPTPTLTATPEFTATPEASATPEATATVEPTATAVPTEAPEETLAPSDTPEPSATAGS